MREGGDVHGVQLGAHDQEVALPLEGEGREAGGWRVRVRTAAVMAAGAASR